MPNPNRLQRDIPCYPRGEFFPRETSPPRTRNGNQAPENKVVALWNVLLNKAQIRRQHSPPTRLFTKGEVAYNETGIACLDNEHVVRVDPTMTGAETRPIHAHRVRPQLDEIVHCKRTHAAGQSPPAESFKDFLAYAIDSRQGLFEMVSRKAHYDAEHSRTKSLIKLLKIKIAEARDCNSELMLGDRYVFRDLVQIAGRGHADGKDDFAQYRLSVTDRFYGEEITVPLTQAGLKFSGKVLQPKEIRRASALLDMHETAVQLCSDPLQTISSKEQLVLSRAGIGRNATVITYWKIAALIEIGQVDKASLDLALEEEIDAARVRRGSGYMHSMAQLESLRNALLDKIATVSQIPSHDHSGSPKHSPIEVALRQRLNSAAPRSATRRTGDPETSSSLSATGTRLPNCSKGVAVLAANNDRNGSAITTSIERAAHQIFQGMANNPVQELLGETGTTQEKSETELWAGFSPSDVVVEITSAATNNPPVRDGPSRAIPHTRYTDDDIDMFRADLLFCGPGIGMNFQRKLAIDDGGSWWRAAFVSVLIEHSSRCPNATSYARRKILKRIQRLGPEFTEEARVIERMMKELTKKFHAQPGERCGAGIRGFMTDLQPPMRGEALSAARPLFESGVSRLKAADEEENDPSRPGEAALKKVAHAMLIKAGFRETEVRDLFTSDTQEKGSVTHIIELMNQLGAREGIIFTRPWVEPEAGVSQYPWLDYKSTTIDFYKMNKPLGTLDNIDTGVQQGDEVQKFIYTQCGKPVIVAEHGRFSVQISHNEAEGWDYLD